MCEMSPIIPKQKFRIWIVYCAFIYDSHIRLILETRLYVCILYSNSFIIYHIEDTVRI